MQTIENVKAMQSTIDLLLERGTLALKNPLVHSDSVANKWILEPLYSGKDCSLGFVHISHLELGPCDAHIHKNSIEYLIVVKGSIILNVDGRDIRVVREGECCAVPAGSMHFSKPMSDDTKLVYICVPEDDDIPPPTGPTNDK